MRQWLVGHGFDPVELKRVRPSCLHVFTLSFLQRSYDTVVTLALEETVYHLLLGRIYTSLWLVDEPNLEESIRNTAGRLLHLSEQVCEMLTQAAFSLIAQKSFSFSFLSFLPCLSSLYLFGILA